VVEAVEVAVPAAVHELSLLDRVDYEDAFRAGTSVQRTPEQWMRALVQGAPPWFQAPWIGMGVVVLGVRPGPLRGPDHVLGWKVLVDRDDLFVVGLDSPAGFAARLVMVTAPGQVTFATQIRVGGVRTRTPWPAIRRGHRFFAPFLLARAVDRESAVTVG
jgi:hypothetical protein